MSCKCKFTLINQLYKIYNVNFFSIILHKCKLQFDKVVVDLNNQKKKLESIKNKMIKEKIKVLTGNELNYNNSIQRKKKKMQHFLEISLN